MIRLVLINKSEMTIIISFFIGLRHNFEETLNQNDGLIKFGLSI